MASLETIEKIWAREVLNLRGNSTVEAEVILADGSYGVAAVPAGISTGSHEGVQLLDGDPKRFGGHGRHRWTRVPVFRRTDGYSLPRRRHRGRADR